MNDEEKKLNEPVAEADFDDDFADALPLAPAAEEPAEETKTEEPEAPKEPEEPVVDQGGEPAPEIDYSGEFDDQRLDSIEAARVVWNRSYKKMSRIKFIVSTITLLGILAGWLVPSLTMKDMGTTPLLIGLGFAVLGIAILVVFGIFQRKHDKAAIRDYFSAYFGACNDFALKDNGCENIVGTVDDKITKEEFAEGEAFAQAVSVGSRDNITFTYKGMECAMAEAAAQADGGKSLQTIFVGKYLRTHNTIDLGDESLWLYFPGNDRALPPSKLESMHLCENGSRYRIYGASANKKVLTKKIRDALGKIHTNKLLVDLTIVIKSGRTYWYIGYEDDLMVLPNDKTFDPRFVKQYKDEIAVILDAATLMNANRDKASS